MIDEKVVEIIDSVQMEADGPVFTEENRRLIKEAAGLAKESAIYKRSAKEYPERFKEGKAADLYIEMLEKIVDAPTSIHRMAVPRLMLPAISNALEREGNENGNV